jgi:magnesium transporter
MSAPQSGPESPQASQPAPAGAREQGGTSGGVLGARPQLTRTFDGHDPATVAASTISAISPTHCQARTRLYRAGRLELEGFPVAQISDHLADKAVTIWLDLRAPDRDDLAVLSDEFGLHPLAIEAAVQEHERPRLDHYRSHLFLTAYAAQLDTATGTLATSELSAFITPQALITVRKDDGLDIGSVVERWDADSDLAKFGVAFLLYGLLDYIVDGQFDTVQSMDEALDALEDQLFDPTARNIEVQRRIFELRKSLVLLRRIVIPMREVVGILMRPDLQIAVGDLKPYYQDVYDHVLRTAEWTDSLRDLVTSVLETNLTIQSNRLNIITKKVTGWAAIIAVPTLITGYFGMNVPYPGFGKMAGFALSVGVIIVAGLVLYLTFKRKDWL